MHQKAMPKACQASHTAPRHGLAAVGGVCSLAWHVQVSLLVAVLLIASYSSAPENAHAFQADLRSGVLQRVVSNSSNHLYPYVAAVFTCGCIMVVIMAIIMFGGSL